MSPDDTFNDVYNRLCRRFVEYVRQEQTRTRKCTHCGKTEKEHDIHDQRCTCYATSMKFLDINRDEVNKVAESIALLRKLSDLHGWGF